MIMNITHISAITLAARSMDRAVAFYQRLGFELSYGDRDASFVSLKAGEAIVNLAASRTDKERWWGRVIFRVEGADALYHDFKEKGFAPEQPRDGEWGERFFHITDPDGHELSFAEVLPRE